MSFQIPIPKTGPRVIEGGALEGDYDPRVKSSRMGLVFL